METALVDEHDGILFDLDGVLYAGSRAVEGAVEALEELGRRSISHAFVTNNAARSPEAIAEHLRALGIPAHPKQVFGSAPVGVAMMAEHLPPGAPVLVTGSEYLRDRVVDAGFEPVGEAELRPEAVIQGFDPALGWKDLAEASYAVQSGAQWFATNLDRTVPRDRGIAPGNGALVDAVAAATGRRPHASGKPEPVMFRTAAESLGLTTPLVVGDRLDTDVLGGNRAGYRTALALTGVDTSRSASAAETPMQPDVVLRTLNDLFSAEHASFRSTA